MTSKKVYVTVEWLGKKALQLPEGNQYITVAKFSEDNAWSREAWGIVLKFDSPPKQQGNPSNGIAYFLSETAPANRLIKGNTFELYEGNNLVAKANIISEFL